MPHTRALVLSGGQDSATCLAWTLARYEHVETIDFDYGQRHRIELDCRTRFVEQLKAKFPHWAAKLGPDHVIDLHSLGQVSDTALTADKAIAYEQSGLPNTFVPGRNIVSFTYAAAVAYRRGISVLVGGMCETDYSGYPDCRDDTLKSLQVTLGLALDTRLVIETPLMWIDKAGTWRMAQELGGNPLLELVEGRDPHLLLGRPRHRACVGLRLRRVPGVRTPREGLRRVHGIPALNSRIASATFFFGVFPTLTSNSCRQSNTS